MSEALECVFNLIQYFVKNATSVYITTWICSIIIIHYSNATESCEWYHNSTKTIYCQSSWDELYYMCVYNESQFTCDGHSDCNMFEDEYMFNCTGTGQCSWYGVKLRSFLAEARLFGESVLTSIVCIGNLWALCTRKYIALLQNSIQDLLVYCSCIQLSTRFPWHQLIGHGSKCNVNSTIILILGTSSCALIQNAYLLVGNVTAWTIVVPYTESTLMSTSVKTNVVCFVVAIDNSIYLKGIRCRSANIPLIKFSMSECVQD